MFISWSQEQSRAVALALHQWLPLVLQNVKPWMSSSVLEAGARWSVELTGALQVSKVGILCVTRANQQEPWLLFEAGALGKTLERTFVCHI